MIFSKIYNLFLAIFFPKICVGCGTYGSFLCQNCATKIEVIKTATCPECGKISQLGKYCTNCKARLHFSLDAVLIAARFDAGPTKELIHNLKYNGLAELSELLGEIVYKRILAESPMSNLIVTFVPLHRRRLGDRGYNQAELIANYVCHRLDVPCAQTLKRIRNTTTQTKLSRQDRLANIQSAFRCISPEIVVSKNILLIDDVMTTGATLNECAKVLKKAGAKKVFAAVVARNI